ncbi:olfactory receptor 5AP2-like [Pelobates fuscus]|uniref:olfactory receptor 5AP2-like n=1 Tax=Pelobates fuscus TaxID=191477 RepID=UPI002FE4CC49
MSKHINSSRVNEFILMDFSERHDLQTVLFFLFLLMYLFTVLGNSGIIFLVYHNANLHTPMYYFISSLSFLDICYSTDIVPQMIAVLLSEKKTISYVGCAVQLFFFCAFGSTKCCLFAVMAYDRHVAICNPLNYSLLMQERTCWVLVSGAYTIGFLHSVIETCCTFSLSFCSSNILHHFACDFPSLLSLSCTDTTANKIVLFIFSSLFVFPPVLIILTSYVSIFLAIMKIKASESRKKAFSTCVSHIISVTLLYGTIFYAYLSPKSKYSSENGAGATFVYAVAIPMLNPIIYSFRNKDIKTAMQVTFHEMITRRI